MIKLVDIYRTSNLSKYGLFLFVVLLVFVVAGPLLIPRFHGKISNQQIANINGNHFKYNDEPQVSQFLQSIKSHNGYLVLGTSESGDIASGNYYNFLNNDTDITPRFSVLSGAGRTCGMHIPMFLNHRDESRGLKVIYLINPAYWRANLCVTNKEYLTRYLNYNMCRNMTLSDEERAQFSFPIDAFSERLNIFERLLLSIDYGFRNLRKCYFQDLRYHLNPRLYDNKFNYIPDDKVSLTNYEKFGEINTDEIDTVWNMIYSYTHQGWFRPVNETNENRTSELRAFIAVCKALGIKCTFILGPYNERFINNYSPEALAGYQRLAQNTKELLITEDVDYIDANDISAAPGAFVDHQHHSSYGAYLLYLKIKEHIHEAENN
ncbi:MAG: hypothetical protein KKA07_04365 [Bacteroidetes bacterium]|nr:hypothetical protein [Bacteroidota bacterium]MBU1718286.1 hypothetical protein [Bacteroidota bacterium]